MTQLVFLIHIGSTLMMAGLIWLIQLVHYPLFQKVGSETYTDYQLSHMNRITPLVFVLMGAELVTAGALLFIDAPETIPVWSLALGFVLVVALWLSTAILQVPAHSQLTSGFDVKAYRFLVRSNWVRTVGWTLRGVLVLWMVGQVM